MCVCVLNEKNVTLKDSMNRNDVSVQPLNQAKTFKPKRTLNS